MFLIYSFVGPKRYKLRFSFDGEKFIVYTNYPDGYKFLTVKSILF